MIFNKIININHTITKFATIAPYTCLIMCTNFSKKRTTFAKVTLNRMNPSFRTVARERPKGEGSIGDHFITKFSTVVSCAYMRMCPNFVKKMTTFAEVMQHSVEHSHNQRRRPGTKFGGAEKFLADQDFRMMIFSGKNFHFHTQNF